MPQRLRSARSCRLALALAAAVAWFAAGWLANAQAQITGYESPAGHASPARGSSGTLYLPYSAFLNQVERNQVLSVVIDGQDIRGRLKSGKRFAAVIPAIDNAQLVGRLMGAKVRISADRPWSAFNFTMADLLIGVLIVGLVLIAAGYFRNQRRKSGLRGTDLSSFAKSRAHRLEPDAIAVTFSDAAGIEEAKHEVAEIVEFLKDPAKFRRLGGKIPRGVLMVGPPGTGKTLLARAIAGEAKVPFFSACGADFVEMFVGVGAARVRDLFAQARKQSPCIVFVDEIDALGRHRGAAGGGGSDEREQTLNQLLVEMDGFDATEGIIVIAATNRPDVLDSALLRPGRFDRQVVVPLPDMEGRERILRVHLRHVPLAADVKPGVIARGTPGFSGADLAGLVNEAALFAARADKQAVGMVEFERARDKVMLGAERQSLKMSSDERRLTAYHEAGHAIVGLNVPDHDPLYKVSILPRGCALGLTVYLPEIDRYSETRSSLESRICALLGGRLAEVLTFGLDRVTTGAANDLAHATAIARRMVTHYGMSDALGPLDYGAAGEAGDPRAASAVNGGVSGETARAIDAAVREIVERNYARARAILETHRDVLNRLANALIERETLDRKEIDEIVHATPAAGDSVCRVALAG